MILEGKARWSEGDLEVGGWEMLRGFLGCA